MSAQTGGKSILLEARDGLLILPVLKAKLENVKKKFKVHFKNPLINMIASQERMAQ